MKLPIRIPRLAGVVPWLLLTFLVLFPKGGVKFGSVPLTWGYAILGISFFPLLLIRTLYFPLRTSRTTLAAVASIIPFQLIFFYSLFVNGSANSSYAIAIITILLFLPVLFLCVFPAFLRYVDYDRFVRYFCFCILAAAIWGIFLFFYHPIMHKFIEIPYFTVNAGDYGQIENTKNISRGSYLKLISTYNNGNLYGVATFILLPLYAKLEPRRWKRNVLRVALVLTLSRTVWAGLVLEQALSVMVKIPSILGRFPKIRPGQARRQIAAVAGTICLTLTGLLFNGSSLAFLFDSSLGGREGELVGFSNPTFLPQVPVTSFAELVYASALMIFGISGFLAIMLIFITPVLLILWKPHLVQSVSGRAAAKGLILYAAIASVDGAILLIPVMAFYWFVYMTMLHGLPGERAPHRVPVLPTAALSYPPELAAS